MTNVEKIAVNKPFHNFLACTFLNGFKKGKAHNKNMAAAKIETNFRSNRNPNTKALPENGFPNGLNCQ